MSSNVRSKRIEELLRRALGEALLRYPHAPVFSRISITAVRLNADCSIARVFFSVFNDDERVIAQEALQQNSKFLRQLMAKKLNLRITPTLTFFFDDSLQRARKITSLINQLSTNEGDTDGEAAD